MPRAAARRWMRRPSAPTLAALACVCLAQPGSGHAGDGASLLYNPGPRWEAGLTLVKGAGGNTCHVAGSSLAEVADVPGRPTEGRFQRDCVGGAVSSGGTAGAPSFYNDTRFGWTAGDIGRNPGWSVEDLGGGGGAPLLLRYVNRAHSAEDACRLREVGLVYQAWPKASDTAVKLNADGSRPRLGQFASLEARFAARVVEVDGPPRCPSMTTSYITMDFRVVYVGSRPSDILRSDLVGVVFYEVPGSRPVQPAADPTIFWRGRGHNGTNTLLRGARLPNPVAIAGGDLQHVTVDLKPLLKYLPPPPPGHSLDDAVIAGLDIYSAVRGADIVFDVTDVDLRGGP